MFLNRSNKNDMVYDDYYHFNDTDVKNVYTNFVNQITLSRHKFVFRDVLCTCTAIIPYFYHLSRCIYSYKYINLSEMEAVKFFLFY